MNNMEKIKVKVKVKKKKEDSGGDILKSFVLNFIF